jgi:energy-coupling factor transporter ATP-binding protein EcfA2
MLTSHDLPLQPLTAPLTDTGTDEGKHNGVSAAYEGLPPLNAADVASEVLVRLWAGDPAVLVKSPPGAGKTTLLASIAGWLSVAAGLKVLIAAQRTGQAIDVANRIATLAPATTVTLLGRSGGNRPKDLHASVHFANKISDANGTGVIIANTAKLEWVTKQAYLPDVLFVDEAFQCVWGSLASILTATQFLLVGDPGQIDPVVTAEVGDWEGRVDAPHQPAPYGFLRCNPTTRQFTLPNTRRCGPDTAKVLQPFYDFAFGSVRPPRTVSVAGAAQAELGLLTIDGDSGREDPAVVAAVAGRARALATNGTLTDEHGVTRPLTDADVAVLVAHNTQAAAVQAELADLPGITVGTLDSLQGREFIATILWSPMACKSTVAAFDLNPGRLCVGLSRHVAHCTVVEREDTRMRVMQAHADGIASYGTITDVLALLTDAADEVVL